MKASLTNVLELVDESNVCTSVLQWTVGYLRCRIGSDHRDKGDNKHLQFKKVLNMID